MLVSETMAISKLRILNGISMGLMKCLNEDAQKKKKDALCTLGVGPF